MQMPWKTDNGFWTVILGWLKLNWPTIYGAVLAVQPSLFLYIYPMNKLSLYPKISNTFAKL